MGEDNAALGGTRISFHRAETCKAESAIRDPASQSPPPDFGRIHTTRTSYTTLLTSADSAVSRGSRVLSDRSKFGQLSDFSHDDSYVITICDNLTLCRHSPRLNTLISRICSSGHTITDCSVVGSIFSWLSTAAVSRPSGYQIAIISDSFNKSFAGP